MTEHKKSNLEFLWDSLGPIIGFGIFFFFVGGWKAVIGIYLFLISGSFCVFFWFSFYTHGKRVCERLGYDDWFEIVYFSLFIIFIIAIVVFISSGGGIKSCPRFMPCDDY